jgi:argonaute-like protein implicated in RNA metabolism and viral defense
MLEFESEIGDLLSRFNKLKGFVAAQKHTIESQKNEINNLLFQLQDLELKKQSLKKYNSAILSENKILKRDLAENVIILDKNFHFSDNFTSIVKDIENQTIDAKMLSNVLGEMVKEIDRCIGKLKE